jgi:hypothetical protein
VRSDWLTRRFNLIRYFCHFFCPARRCPPRQAASSLGPRWRPPPPPLTALTPGAGRFAGVSTALAGQSLVKPESTHSEARTETDGEVRSRSFYLSGSDSHCRRTWRGCRLRADANRTNTPHSTSTRFDLNQTEPLLY